MLYSCAAFKRVELLDDRMPSRDERCCVEKLSRRKRLHRIKHILNIHARKGVLALCAFLHQQPAHNVPERFTLSFSLVVGCKQADKFTRHVERTRDPSVDRSTGAKEDETLWKISHMR